MITCTVRGVTSAGKCVWDNIFLAWNVTRGEAVFKSFFPELEESGVGNVFKAGGSEDGDKGLVVYSEEEVREAKNKVAALVKAKH